MNENSKELTAAVNECVAALKGLEKNTGESETLIQLDTVLDDRIIANQINKLAQEEIRAKQF
ncbi:hypothetical protein [Bacillus toyonensis]|uniref:hypothetical protein n=1 Tax=Bacillus toyonensis TaxID=155322 RepID=UPI003D645D83